MSDAAARSTGAITRATFTTEGLPRSQQFDAYRDYCAPVIDIVPGERVRSGVSASCDMWMLGRLALRRIHAPAGALSRRAAQVRLDGLDHWVFNLALHGTQEACTDDALLRTDAGALSLFSLAGAYDARRTTIDWLGLFVPRGAFPGIDAGFRHNEHVILDNPLGRVLAAYLASLADELPSMAAGDLPRVIAATEAMLAACAVASSSAIESGDTQLDLPRLRRVRDIIDRNLGSWALHTGRLCKLAEISRSNLYRMFEPYGGVVRYIQQQRLRRAHDQLADPNCTRMIGLIADDYCFTDASAFSRAFRREYGYSPSDVREWARTRGTRLSNDPLPSYVATMGTWDALYRF